jgi:hypothetical protein
LRRHSCERSLVPFCLSCTHPPASFFFTSDFSRATLAPIVQDVTARPVHDLISNGPGRMLRTLAPGPMKPRPHEHAPETRRRRPGHPAATPPASAFVGTRPLSRRPLHFSHSAPGNVSDESVVYILTAPARHLSTRTGLFAEISNHSQVSCRCSFFPRYGTMWAKTSVRPSSSNESTS